MKKKSISMFLLITVLSLFWTLPVDAKTKVVTVPKFVDSSSTKQITKELQKVLTEMNFYIVNFKEFYLTNILANELVSALCDDTKDPEICKLIIDQAKEISKDIKNTNISNDLKELAKQTLPALHQSFLSLNNKFISLLKIQREILINHLEDNEGSKKIDILIKDIEQNLSIFETSYQNLIISLQPFLSITVSYSDLNKDKAMLSINEYDKALSILFSSYEFISQISDITAHFLRATNDIKIISNHSIYAKDLLTLLEIGAKYYGLDVINVKNLIVDTKNSKGLLTKLSDAGTPIKTNLGNWLTLFVKYDDEQKNIVKESQKEVNNALADIYYTEFKIAREICAMKNAEFLNLCTYAFGTVIKAVINDENAVSALCSQTVDPEKCLANASLINEAYIYTKTSENPSFKIFASYIGKNSLSEEAYNAVIDFVNIVYNVSDDKVLTAEEKQIILQSFINLCENSEYYNEKIDNVLGKVCRKTDDKEECSEFVKELIKLGYSLYSEEASFDEGINSIVNLLIDDVKLDNLESVQETLNKLYKFIDQSLIYNELITKFVKNRDYDELEQHLIDDYNYIFAQKDELKKNADQLISTLAELEKVKKEIAETKALNDLVELTNKATNLVTDALNLGLKVAQISTDLKNYYINNYSPNVYSGTYLVVDHTYSRNLERTKLMVENAQDIINVIKPNYPDKNFVEIDKYLSEISNLEKANSLILPKAVDLLKGILVAEKSLNYFNEQKVKEVQDNFNKGMLEMIKKKFDMLYRFALQNILKKY